MSIFYNIHCLMFSLFFFSPSCALLADAPKILRFTQHQSTKFDALRYAEPNHMRLFIGIHRCILDTVCGTLAVLGFMCADVYSRHGYM